MNKKEGKMRFSKNKKFKRKEVKKMKRIFALAAAVILAIAVPNAMATTGTGTVSKYDQVIHVYTEYNAYGVAISSTNTTTTTVETTDKDGNVTTQVSTTVTKSTYKNGNLSPDTSHIISTTTDGDGNVISKNDITDTYTYDNSGNLIGASGSGTMSSYDPDTGQTRTGSISRSFIIKDGQALLTNSTTSNGKIFDKNGSEIGSFTNSMTIADADYVYLGGRWVPTKEVSVSSSNMNDGGSETVTRITTYTRDNHGVITNMSQTASGTRVEVTGNNNGGTSTVTYTLANYQVEVAFDQQMGWYIASESYDWQTVPPPSDPMIYGTVTTVDIDGVTYVAIAADQIDILDGQGLQAADGEIWILSGEPAEELLNYVGEKVIVAGDIASSTGDYFTLDIRKDYGGGIVTDNVDQVLASYQQSSWYQTNLAAMCETWAQVEANYGAHSDWRQGVQFLMLLLGL